MAGRLRWTSMVILALTWLSLAVALPTPTLREQLLAPDGFDALGFYKSVLVASGAEAPDELKTYEQRLEHLVEATVRLARERVPRGGRLDETLMATLHKEFLTDYRADIGDLRVTLRTGLYNCLSATALYVMVGRAAGLSVSAYGMHGHVMPLVFDENGAWYIEATNPHARATRNFEPARYAYLETLRNLPTEDTVVLKVSPDRLRDLQLSGDDEGAVDVDRAPVTREAAEALALKRAKEMKESAYDADPRALASMFYWNRAISAARANKREEMVVGLGGFGALASPVDLENTRPLRMRILLDVALAQRTQDGFEKTLRLMDQVIGATRSDTERKAMGQVRMMLLREESEKLPREKRCAFMKGMVVRYPSDAHVSFLQVDTCGAR